MSYIVMAIEHRADGTQETRYVSEVFDTESSASLHADIVRVTWVDPKIKVEVREEAGGEKEKGRIVYTNAPPDYDYSYVIVLDPEFASFTGTAGTHPVIRKLRLNTNDYRCDYQCGRYASGLHSVMTQEEFDKGVECGLISINEIDVPGPSPTGALCADCLSPAPVDEIGSFCSQCGRGIVIGSGLEDPS